MASYKVKVANQIAKKYRVLAYELRHTKRDKSVVSLNRARIRETE